MPDIFDCLFYVPLKNILLNMETSLLSAKDLCSAFCPWAVRVLPHLLWHRTITGTTCYNDINLSRLGFEHTTYYKRDNAAPCNIFVLYCFALYCIALHCIVESRLGRHFYISQQHAGCQKDTGWLVVSEAEKKKPCKWEKQKPYPQFMYSRIGKATKWNDKSK